MRRIPKFFSLSLAEKCIFFRAVSLLSYSRCLLQFLPLKDVAARLPRRGIVQNPVRRTDLSPGMIGCLLKAAARLVPFSTCLSTSLAGLVLYQYYGYQTVLHIGVKNGDYSSIEAHAWLTFKGSIVVGSRSDIDDYQEMPCVFAVNKYE